jgi:hypothetical protein
LDYLNNITQKEKLQIAVPKNVFGANNFHFKVKATVVAAYCGHFGTERN